jgi:hypothetical protein
MPTSIFNDGRVHPLVWLFASAYLQFNAFWRPFSKIDAQGSYYVSPKKIIYVGVVGVAALVFLSCRLRGHSRLSTAVVLLLACIAGAYTLFPALYWSYVSAL